MNKLKIVRLFFSLFLYISLASFVSAYTSPGKPTGFVNDFASVLTQEQKVVLEQKIVAFNASTSNEIAVVVVKSLGGDYIENYSVKLFEEWKIGQAKKDNGVLLLVAIDDHKVRIEVGYGLEGVLTDSLSAQIIAKDILPSFKQNNFYQGIAQAVDHIILATEGEYTVDGKSTQRLSISFETISILFVLGAQLLSFIASLFARSKSWWAGGVVGGVLGGVATFFGVFGLTLVVGSIITAVLIIVGLLLDYIVSHTYARSIQTGSSIPWWVGGKGFGGGRGGFGGFGGGRSGGGGASGSW